MSVPLTATQVRQQEQEADEEERARMLRLAAVEGIGAGPAFSVVSAAEIAEKRLTESNWHSESQIVRALVRHVSGLLKWAERASSSADGMQAELALRSRELGETVIRAEKAEKKADDFERRFEMQRTEILRLQKEINGARRTLQDWQPGRD
jgi:hypothetical protein